MKLPLLISTILLAALPAFAQESWVGFKPVEDVNLSFKAYMENSIVLIDSFNSVGDLKEKGYDIVDVNKVAEEKNPKKLEPNTDPTQPQKNLKAIQIETCRKQGLRFCPVFKVSSMSTGFFENGTRLTSCRHSYHNWLVWASEANDGRPVETLSPPMIIYTKDWKVIYNSATVPVEQMLSFSFLNKDSRINVADLGTPETPSKAFENYGLSDVGQLESPVELVPAQPVKYDLDFMKYTDKEEVYSAGYPGKTDFFTDSSLDAPGGKLVVSSARIYKIIPKKLLVKTRNVTKTGMSGAPLFKKNGKILGLLCSGTNPQKDQPETASAVYTILDQSLLEDLWSSFQF